MRDSRQAPEIYNQGVNLFVAIFLSERRHFVVDSIPNHRRQHIINLFVWPTESKTDHAPTSRTYRGYHAVHWTQSAFDFWAVSDLNEKELAQFAGLLTSKGR